MSKINLHYSTITKKIVMSLLGVFLMMFLLVHLIINLLYFADDNGRLFNIAAHFMQTNIFIKIFEVVLFGGFIIHIILGLILQIQNWLARPKRYKVYCHSQKSYFSKYMIHTAVIILVFLTIHLLNFYLKVKFFGSVDEVIYDGKTYHDLSSLMYSLFHIAGYVIFYIIAFIILGFHLNHAFQSAFQSLGLNHSVYTPYIKAIGLLFSIIIPLGFTIIPILIYFS